MAAPDPTSEPRPRLDQGEPRRPPRRVRRYLALFLFAGAVAGVWYVLDQGLVRVEFGELGEPPLIKAEPGPTKIRPAEPGGMEVPNQDKLVYGTLNPEEAEGVVERLLPPPQEPLPKPEVEAFPSAEQATAMAPLAAEGSLAPGPGGTAASSEPAPAPASVKVSEPARVEKEVAAVAPAAPSSGEPAAQAAARTVLVQVGSYRAREQAERAWRALLSAHVDLLEATTPVVQRVDLGPDKGVFFRLRIAGVDGKSAAEALCRKLKTRKQDCLVVSP